MNIPTLDQCYAAFAHYKTSQNIINHSVAVNKIANYIASAFNKAGQQVDENLIDRASLMHDVLRRKPKHAQAGANVFKQDYPEMAEIIRKHANMALLENELQTWEEKIVYYADKRVNHDQVVTLDIRMSEGKKRWKVDPENDKSAELLVAMKKLETEIFNIIKQDPNALNEQ